MNGNNEIKLCKAEWIQAMQEWIDSRFMPAHRQVIVNVVERDGQCIISTKPRDEPEFKP